MTDETNMETVDKLDLITTNASNYAAASRLIANRIAVVHRIGVIK